MDEKTYLDEYRRDLRNRGLQKPISRVCAVSSIKPEFQSSVMMFNIRAQLWDPSGRIYILTRVDKLLNMFNERVMQLGKVKGENVVTGFVLIYPSMAFLALEVPSDCTLALNTVMVENMGTAESYVLPPKLISEAHGTYRMFDKLTSVILSIPGPMKMDLDRMRAEWMLSFKHIMKKVYKMSEVLTSDGIASLMKDGLSHMRSAKNEPSEALSPQKISMQSLPSRFANGTNRSTSLTSDPGDADQNDTNFNDNNESHMVQCVGKKSKNNESVFNQNYGVHAHGESFNAELSTTHIDGVLDPVERERKREQFVARRIAHDMALLDQEMQQTGMQDVNRNAVAPSLRRSRSRSLAHRGSVVDAFNLKAKRMMLNFGDPTLKFIPPQRDLVLVLNCDKFRPLSDSVKLHSRKWNLSAADGNGWPQESDNQRLPLDAFRDKSTSSRLT